MAKGVICPLRPGRTAIFAKRVEYFVKWESLADKGLLFLHPITPLCCPVHPSIRYSGAKCRASVFSGAFK